MTMTSTALTARASTRPARARRSPTTTTHTMMTTTRVVSTAASADASDVTPASLEGDDAESWARAESIVASLGLDDASADKAMRRAFGWSTQAYWRNSKVREVPDATALEERIAFLETLGVTRDDVRRIVEKTPEILGCDVDQLTTATEYVEKNYFMKRNTRNFVKYVVRVPQALGNNLDCAAEGKSCLGECNRCWARC
jgi:hypothetical protein